MADVVDEPLRVDQFEVEKKYGVPAEFQQSLESKLRARFGEPHILEEEDLHGFTSSTGHYLRLRRSAGKLKLIAKGPTTLTADGIRSRREVEVPLAPESLEAARNLVALLCVTPLPTMRRQRLAWQLQDAEVVLDRLDALPGQVYIEVEVLGTDESAARARLRALEVDLCLDPAWQETRSYAQILQEAGTPPTPKKML